MSDLLNTIGDFLAARSGVSSTRERDRRYFWRLFAFRESGYQVRQAAGIQGIRLEYVEFFGKFYEGGGDEYRPFGYERKYTAEE